MSRPTLSSRSHFVPLAVLLLNQVLVVALEKPWHTGLDLFSAPRHREAFLGFSVAWIWFASALNLVLAIALLASWKWWIKDPAPGTTAEPRARVRVSAFQRLLLGLSIAAAAFAGFPRLTHSLWGDEQIAFIGSVAGGFSHDAEGDGLEDSVDRIYWAEAGWPDALWQYESPNPHFLCNLGSKLTLTGWQKARNEQPWVVHEPALRLLPFLAGLAALAVWFRLGWTCGAGRATGWACLALSIHPWFIRHITEARGYPFVFLFLPLVLLALRNATRDPRWRNWIIHGILGGLLVYSWPGMIVTWVCLNATAILANAAKATPRFPARRLVLSNLLLGMGLLTLVAPCFAQLGTYLQSDATRLPLNATWLRDLAARLFLGIDWHDHESYSEANSAYLSFESLWKSPPSAVLLLVAAAGGIFGLGRGLALIWRKHGFVRQASGALTASALTISLAGAVSGLYLFPWYFVFLLPGLALVCVTGLASFAGSGKWHRVPVAAILVAYAVLSLRGTAALRPGSEDPRRESALATRGTLDPMEPRNRRILTAHVGTNALAYDPLGWYLEEFPDPGEPGLPALMRMADVLERELLINVGYPRNARVEAPTVMRLIDKSGFFERIRTLPGLEPQFEREIYRYKGGMFARFRKSPNN